MTDVQAAYDQAPNDVGAAIDRMLEHFLPSTIPSETSLGLGTVTVADLGGEEFGGGPSEALANAIFANFTAQAAQTTVPFADQMATDFSTIVDSMAFVDTSVVTTDENFQDMMLENPVAATPWDDGSEKAFTQYNPLFTYRSDRKATSPGFHTVATPVVINQIQARLLQTERDAALFGLTAPARGRPRPVSTVVAAHALAVDKRIRLLEARTPHDRVRPGTQQQVVDSSKLETLRYYGALKPEDLHAKYNYAGPITQIWDSQGANNSAQGGMLSSAGSFAGRPLLSERVFNYSHYYRGKINNIFACEPVAGDQFFFSIARYNREQLLQIGSAAGVLLGKRTYASGDDAPHSSFVGSIQRSSTADEFVQIRGWSSREGREYLGDTSPLESLKPDAADRYYVERVELAASVYRQHRYNDVTDELEVVNLAAQEGRQEAVANVPDLVLENFLALGVVIPVGTVKQVLSKKTTLHDILNAHYDSRLLSAQPHVEIYQHC